MGSGVFCLHSVLRLPFLSSLSTPNSGIPVLSVKEIAQRSCNASRERSEQTEWPEDDPPPTFNGRSPVSPNKEAILELFKRIQSSISKGETMKPQKRKNSKDGEEKNPFAESVMEVFQQSRTQPKEKTFLGRGNKSAGKRKDSRKVDGDEHSLIGSAFRSARPPSNFRRRSPIPPQASPPGPIQSEKEQVEVRATVSVLKEAMEHKMDTTSDANVKNADMSLNFDQMKVHQLKEAAKSRGMRGYSKMKKGELVERLMRSVGGAAAP